jgi:hypothetical protein
MKNPRLGLIIKYYKRLIDGKIGLGVGTLDGGGRAIHHLVDRRPLMRSAKNWRQIMAKEKFSRKDKEVRP